MPRMNEEQFQRICRVLADPRRLEILGRIAAAEEVACADLVSTFPVSQATMSHHLKELANAGLIKIRREAKFCFYRPRRKMWAAYLSALQRRIPKQIRKR